MTFRGTPRIANRLLKRVRDYAQVVYDGKINEEISKEGLNLLEVDSLGLDCVDRKILLNMINNFNGGPVGVETIAASTGEERVTIEDVANWSSLRRSVRLIVRHCPASMVSPRIIASRPRSS